MIDNRETVTVRIAVEVNHLGQWFATGQHGETDEANVDALDPRFGSTIHIVTAEIEIQAGEVEVHEVDGKLEAVS